MARAVMVKQARVEAARVAVGVSRVPLRGDRRRLAGMRPARQQIVAPFARALMLLGAFTALDRWLGNGDLSERTGLPPSTVNRIANTLESLGYLHHSPTRRKFRLAAPVLALGHTVLGGPRVQRAARIPMRAFAEQHRVQVYLSFRRGLSLEILERCLARGLRLPLDAPTGARVGIVDSPMGWALLAGLPELEREYLLDNAHRRSPDEQNRLLRSSSDAVEQVHARGYCGSLDPKLPVGVVATPILIAGEAPLVLACIGDRARMSWPRIDHDLGPGLLAVAATIHAAGGRA